MPRGRLIASPAGEIRSRLNRHFASCASIVAGVAVLGLAGTADASVVYSGPENIAVSVGGSLYLNLETDVSNRLTSKAPGWDIGFTGGTNVLMTTSPSSGVGVAITPSKLDAGVTVSSSLLFSSNPYILASATYYGSSGQWLGGVTNKFIGLSFTTTDGSLHYGWVRINVAQGEAYGNTTFQVTVTDWAYESNSNTPIITGDTGTAVPEPGSAATLGTLALGALGVRSRRRKAV